jgi:hypothetical protein
MDKIKIATAFRLLIGHLPTIDLSQKGTAATGPTIQLCHKNNFLNLFPLWFF